MKRVIYLLAGAALCAPAQVHLKLAEFSPGIGGRPDGWAVWAPRPEIAPRTFVDRVRYRTAPGSLAISGNSNPAEFGGWEYTARGVQAGNWYRFAAWYRAEGAAYERLQVVSRLDWIRDDGHRAGQPDYVYPIEQQGEWNRVSLDARAPENAVAVRLQLFLQNAPAATVWWDDISLDEIAAPGKRPVRVAAVDYRPERTTSPAENVSLFLDVVGRAVPAADIILLPEGITVVGNHKPYAEAAETIPGPTTARLGEMARAKHSYIVAGIYEREGPAIYNTAVLIDRAGNVAGKYRKVYLPREEMEGGLTPGSDYPVFHTDFGNIGVMICWDLQYADPARALALRGAELILMPIWGGNVALGKARAIENHVFLASSGYDFPTYILDPDGEVLSQAQQLGTAAIATIDLNRRYADPWLGDMRGRFMKELRLDVNPLAR